jgi:ankyrin repeat protein
MKKLLVVCLAVSCGSLYGAGEPALAKAVKSGNFEEVKAVVRGDLDSQGGNPLNLTPLMYAAKLEKNDLAQALIAAGAKVNVTDRVGDSALMHAVMKGNKDIAQMLIAAGADVTAKNKDGLSVFRAAIDNGDKEIVQMLIDTKKVNLEERSPGRMAYTPLMLAVTSHESNYPVEKIVETLINAGADVNAKNGHQTAVDLAKNDEIKAILRKAGGKSGIK